MKSLRGLFALLFVFSVFVSTQDFAAASQKPSLVVLGDSLSAGYQLPPGKGFPDRLQAALDERGISVSVVGAGVSGDTTSGGLSRLDWSVPENTDGVLIELGANDALRGLPPETTRKNLETMIEKLQARGTKVMLAGMMAPPNMGADYGDAFNAIYPDLAETYGVTLYPFFLDGVAAQPKLNLSDGIHPNEEGIEVIVKNILPTVEKFVEELRPTP